MWEAYADPLYTLFPATAFQKQGRVAAMAETQAVPISQLKHSAENTDYLDELFNNNKVFK